MEIRSEEVQEILGTPPGWIIRWGSILALICFVILAWLSFWVRYPDIVEADIRITFKDPPAHLKAAASNYIQTVLVQNNQEVQEGQALLVLRSSADFRHVMHLNDFLVNILNLSDSTLANLELPTGLVLGELQEDLFTFWEKQQQHLTAKDSKYDKMDIRSVQRQISSLERQATFDRKAKEKLAEQITNAQVEERNQQYLVTLKRASSADLTAIQDRISNLQEQLNNKEAAIREKQFVIASLKNRITSLEGGVERSVVNSSAEMRDAFFKLKTRVEAWMKTYMLTAPVDGTVQVVGSKTRSDQFVQQGEDLLVVIPANARQMEGLMNIPFTGSGMVKEGQRVVVRLQSFPFPEYGAVVGEVSWKSKIPKEELGKLVVPVEVTFAEGLTTTTGKPIESEQELFGRGRVITAEKRFIQRIFNRLPHQE